MAEGKKSAIGEIMEDPNSVRADFLNARTIAYSVDGEMANLEALVAEAREKLKGARAEAKTRSALAAGIGLWIMQKYAEASAALEAAADDANGAYFLGLCRLQTKDYSGAIKSFKKAAQAGQDAFACAMGEAEALRKSGNNEEAMAKVRAFQKTHDGEAELHYQKGRCLEEQGDYIAAMEEFERAVELNPQHVPALFRLAFWHDLRGNDEAALDCYERAAEVRPVRENVLLNLGILYEDTGEYEKAAGTYARLLMMNPTHPRGKMYHQDAVASQNMYYDEATERKQHRTAALLRISLSEFELSARSRGCLEKMNVRTLGDLARLNEEDVSGSKNFGETSLGELRSLLESKGLHFGTGSPNPPRPAGAIASPEAAGAISQPVSSMDLSVRSLKCMLTLGVETVGQLLEKSEKDLLQCPNFGLTSLSEIKKKLTELGLSLKPRE